MEGTLGALSCGIHFVVVCVLTNDVSLDAPYSLSAIAFVRMLGTGFRQGRLIVGRDPLLFVGWLAMICWAANDYPLASVTFTSNEPFVSF